MQGVGSDSASRCERFTRSKQIGSENRHCGSVFVGNAAKLQCFEQFMFMVFLS